MQAFRAFLLLHALCYNNKSADLNTIAALYKCANLAENIRTQGFLALSFLFYKGGCHDQTYQDHRRDK